MAMNQTTYQQYLDILSEELVTALGCTEPIAIAYAAATARGALGRMPERADIKCSGNIIKNAMGVVVPNAGGLKGIQASVIAGILSNGADKELEVLADLLPNDIEQVKQLVNTDYCSIQQIDSDAALHIIVTVYDGTDSACTEIKYAHTNVVRITRNGEVTYEKSVDQAKYLGAMTSRDVLNVDDIISFAQNVNLDDVLPLIQEQITYNMAIAEEGIQGDYGVNIGKTILAGMADTTWSKMRAYAAAASEARMSGSILPVVTNSGSGNQGIACSVPVIIYAQEHDIDFDTMVRALVLSNLLAVHQKTAIGRLSAFCGAVSASCASGAAITYLAGGDADNIKRTIVNVLANIPGIICDGAKASCAAKIASSVDAAIMAHLIAQEGVAYEPGAGIIKADVEDTIAMVGRMACDGMATTDIEILRIMLSH